MGSSNFLGLSCRGKCSGMGRPDKTALIENYINLPWVARLYHRQGIRRSTHQDRLNLLSHSVKPRAHTTDTKKAAVLRPPCPLKSIIFSMRDHVSPVPICSINSTSLIQVSAPSAVRFQTIISPANPRINPSKDPETSSA